MLISRCGVVGSEHDVKIQMHRWLSDVLCAVSFIDHRHRAGGCELPLGIDQKDGELLAGEVGRCTVRFDDAGKYNWRLAKIERAGQVIIQLVGNLCEYPVDQAFLRNVGSVCACRQEISYPGSVWISVVWMTQLGRCVRYFVFDGKKYGAGEMM